MLGFAVIMLIPIDIVRELGITASLGVAWMIVTNKMLLPILLSHLHISKHAATKDAFQESRVERIWGAASGCVEKGKATVIIGVSLVILAVGVIGAHDLRVGDYGIGVPELRPESRYNRDNAKIIEKFAMGTNTLGVVAQTKGVQGACTNYELMSVIEKFDWFMQNAPGTQSVISLPGLAKGVNAGFNEGNIKWRQLPRDPQVMAQSVTPIDTATGLLNPDCSAMQVLIFTTDQQGETIASLVANVKEFAARNNSDKLEFKLATNNMGVTAATNEAVDSARWEMNFAIFGALMVMCMITFRSLRATLCILVPLALVSVLCEALMPLLGIGLKVSTLPVIALGVGVGVDYGIYLYDRIEVHLEEGKSLAVAFFEALKERGTAMVFTAVTMTLGVGTWAMSALKFQADMGVLLAFMFFLNMLGAIFLLPALAAFLIKPHKPAGTPLRARVGGAARFFIVAGRAGPGGRRRPWRDRRPCRPLGTAPRGGEARPDGGALPAGARHRARPRRRAGPLRGHAMAARRGRRVPPRDRGLLRIALRPRVHRRVRRHPRPRRRILLHRRLDPARRPRARGRARLGRRTGSPTRMSPVRTVTAFIPKRAPNSLLSR